MKKKGHELERKQGRVYGRPEREGRNVVLFVICFYILNSYKHTYMCVLYKIRL